MNLNRLYLLSGAYFIFSILLSINEIYGITGLSIYGFLGNRPINLLGAIFFFIAILLFMAGREEQNGLEARVYDASKGKHKNHDDVYTFIDPSGNRITLGEMRKQVNEFLKDSDGKEYLRLMGEEYSPILHKILDEGDEEEDEIARSFLELLGEKREEEEENFRLNKEQRREIYGIFHEWAGSADSNQRQVLNKYNVYFDDSGKNHPKFRYANTGYMVSTSSTPSDVKTGLVLATQIVQLIEKARRGEYEKQQKKKEKQEEDKRNEKIKKGKK